MKKLEVHFYEDGTLVSIMETFVEDSDTESIHELEGAILGIIAGEEEKA